MVSLQLTQKVSIRSKLQEVLSARSEASDSGLYGEEDTDTDGDALVDTSAESQDFQPPDLNCTVVHNKAFNPELEAGKPLGTAGGKYARHFKVIDGKFRRRYNMTSNESSFEIMG